MKIQSVQRALDILSMFTVPHPEYGVTEISEAKGLNKATAWGLITTLEQNGFLKRNPVTRKYRLGAKTYELGMAYAECLEINIQASEVAHSLAHKTKLTTRTGIWDRDAVLVTMVIIPYGQKKMATQIGPRIAAFCTALGKVTLAFLEPNLLHEYLKRAELIPYTTSTITEKNRLIKELDEIRRRGYSISNQELIPGAAGIAAPIFNRDGSFFAGISLGSKKKDQIVGGSLENLSRELINAAYEISQQLGFTPAAVAERAYGAY